MRGDIYASYVCRTSDRMRRIIIRFTGHCEQGNLIQELEIDYHRYRNLLLIPNLFAKTIGAGAYTADTAIAVPLFGLVRQSIHFAVPHFRLRASIFTTYLLV